MLQGPVHTCTLTGVACTAGDASPLAGNGNLVNEEELVDDTALLSPDLSILTTRGRQAEPCLQSTAHGLADYS